jgi:hypothetical protein
MQLRNVCILACLLCGVAALLVVAYAIHGGRGERDDGIDKALDALVAEPVQVSGGIRPWPSSSRNMDLLVAAGCRDRPYMLKRLWDDDMRVRMHCATALGEIGDPIAAEPLMALVEEMRARASGIEGWVYWHWTELWGAIRWRDGVESAAIDALTKIRDPAISTYALQKLLTFDDAGLFGWGRTFSRMLKAQGVEADIRRAVEALEERRRTKGPNANIDCALLILKEGYRAWVDRLMKRDATNDARDEP